uniref:Uncharacterized protein n=1 Tax=Candidatus Kentrum sp. TC TaxID=2126339 RepID=A0A450YQI6_9GAMM|nr:MAG: hypothetical protein BECKTC1821D_GA0114238_101833 [Candidatus Kentron sp. TC]
MSNAGTRPNLWKLPTWAKHLDHYLAVFERALMLLGQEEESPILERELNRLLDVKLVDACVELDKKQRFSHPVAEAKNPPDPKFRETQPYEEKWPDFQWTHIDQSMASKPEKRSFAIECKRLGEPVKGRNLNREYVTKGVIRFQHPDWKYGQKLPDGLMIGYVQNGELNEILVEIDGALRDRAINELARDDEGWREDAVSRLSHRFARKFPISPFRLTHFWLDLRHRKVTQ